MNYNFIFIFIILHCFNVNYYLAIPEVFWNKDFPQYKELYAQNTNFNYRYKIINRLTKFTDVYLEIGVEFGVTFTSVNFIEANKYSVDPSPQFISKRVVKKTSDEFFKIQHEGSKINLGNDYDENLPKSYNVIFIDGMHQLEYIARDFNNALRVLEYDGMIIFDDILPLNEKEQFKIPVNYYIEEEVMKVNIYWTGDGWKLVYFILLHHIECFDLLHFQHPMYRGVVVFKNFKCFLQISDEELLLINNYSYLNDFPKYAAILLKFSKHSPETHY